MPSLLRLARAPSWFVRVSVVKVSDVTLQLRLIDHATRDDLRVFLERLQHVGEPEVRLVSRGNVLAVFGCTQAPAGLLDEVPVVLVMRGFELAEVLAESIDVTVSARALLDRLARMGLLGLELELPDAKVTAPWAGVLPPHSGWQAVGSLDAGSLAVVAKEGATRIAAALPDQPGEALIRKVRAEVWGVEVAPGVPAAAAFAADSMGFLRVDSPVKLSKTMTWTRLATDRGQVVVRGIWG